MNIIKKISPNYNILLVERNKTKKYGGNGAIIIGTHRLLWKEFENIGLVIIDEQHKFGVYQRAKIASHKCNVIMMTATFIPRTMEMAVSQYFPLSKLEAPAKFIETLICHESDEQTILESLFDSREKFVFVMRSIEEAEQYYEKWYKTYSCFLLHSKMQDKISILESFDKSNTGALFTTTVVEVGIDINLSVMIIQKADHFGLSQLHQLRGRLGRRGQKAYCILLGKNMEKLEAIKNAKDGFEISRLDLKNRGAGTLHNIIQSGFNNFIFDKMVENSKILKKEITDLDWKNASNVVINPNILSLFYRVKELI